MNSVYYDVWRRGGFAATHELLRDGHTSHQLTRAVRAGAVVRVRQGHYACPERSRDEMEAVRVGGRLTGVSGARHHGMWTPGHPALVVAVPPDARALRSRTDMTVRLTAVRRSRTSVRWSDHRLPGTRSAVTPLACVIEVARTHDPLIAFAVAESAVRLGLVSRAELLRGVARLPRGRRGRLDAAGRLSESGGESLLKFGLLDAEVGFRQQVTIASAGRVDFLIGRRLVVEADGAAFHTSREAFEEDRRRDAALSSAGYHVLRFSYTQIESRWPEVWASIRAALDRGDHL